MKRRTFIERLAMALSAVFVPTSLLAKKSPDPPGKYMGPITRGTPDPEHRLVTFNLVEKPVDGHALIRFNAEECLDIQESDTWVLEKGPAQEPVTIHSYEEYKDLYGSDLDYLREKIFASMGIPKRYLLGETVHSVVLDEVGYSRLSCR